MPIKVIPTPLTYKGFTQSLKELQAFKVGSKEESRFLAKNNISHQKAPREQDVHDDIYIYYNLNGYRVKVRTTITECPFSVSKSDAAWVIIENEQGKAVMFSQPIHRTKNFFINILNQFRLFQKIVDERPLCKCGADINIKKDGLRKYNLECSMSSIALEHDDPIEVYDFIRTKLSKELYNFLTNKISKNRYNKRKAEEKGKTFGSRILLRKRWVTE